MESISEALIMIFAVLTFVIGLSSTMTLFSQARETSDMVLTRVEEAETTEYEVIDLSNKYYRIVGLESIIPTLYRYEKENLTVVFLKCNNYNADTGEITGIEPLPIYTSVTKCQYWAKSYAGRWQYPTYMDSDGNLIEDCYGYLLNGGLVADEPQICVFDIAEENARSEPFVINRKEFLDKLTAGENIDYTYTGRNVTYNNAGNPLTVVCNKYIEILSNENEENIKGNRTTGRTILTYIKIN